MTGSSPHSSNLKMAPRKKAAAKGNAAKKPAAKKAVVKKPAAKKPAAKAKSEPAPLRKYRPCNAFDDARAAAKSLHQKRNLPVLPQYQDTTSKTSKSTKLAGM